MTEQRGQILIDRLTIIGVGLIGGSFALALRSSLLVNEVVGYGRDPEKLEQALELGLIDRSTTNLCDAVLEADVVMVATPVGAMPQLFDKLKDCIPPECIIIDVGSVKGEVIEAAHASFGQSDVRFVPCHPIAGRERSGAAAAMANLFVGQKVILTPTEDTNLDALDRICAIWLEIGASVIHMDARQHDRLLALTSHLPHMVAYALVSLLADQDDHKDDALNLASGGFYDISRVASSDSVMWRDICLFNRDDIALRLIEYQEAIAHLLSLVQAGDGKALENMFARAKTTRARIEQLSKNDIK